MNKVLLWLRRFRTSSGWRNSSVLTVLALLTSGTLAYIVVIFFFLGSGVGHQSRVWKINEDTEDGEIYHLTLKYIDHIADRIRFDFELNKRQGLKEIVKCLMFGHEFSYVGMYP